MPGGGYRLSRNTSARRRALAPDRQFLAWLAWALALIGLLAALWPILAVDKGIDTGDEALYLLAASAPTPEYFWTNPWGWITRPLWTLSANRLDMFRFLGAVVLTLAYMTLSFVVLAAARHLRGHHRAVGDRWASLGLGMAAGLLYYSGFLRAPGYNWVNLVGITLVSSAGVLWLARSDQPLVSWRRIALPLALAAGLVVSCIGKPSSPAFEVLILIMLGLITKTWRSVVQFLGAVALGIVLLLGAMWPMGFLGSSPLSTIALVLKQPQLVPEQGIVGAARMAAMVPLHLVLWAAQYWYYSIGVVLVVLAVLLTRRGRVANWVAPSVFAVMVACSVLIWMGALPAATREHNTMLRPEAVLSTVGLLVATIAYSFNGTVKSPSGNAAGSSRWARPRVAVLVFMCAQPMVFGFGMSNGPYLGMTWALGFIFLAALFVLATSTAPRSGFGAALVAAALLCSAGWCMLEGRQFAYGMRPIAEQTTPVLLGNPSYAVMVDTGIKRDIEDMKQAAATAGMPVDQSLATVIGQWSTLTPLAVGGQPPPSLMVTLFTTPAAPAMAEFNLQRPELQFDWEHAWIATRPSQMSLGGNFPVQEVVAAVAGRAGLRFPQDYVLASRVGDFELWRPSR